MKRKYKTTSRVRFFLLLSLSGLIYEEKRFHYPWSAPQYQIFRRKQKNWKIERKKERKKER
jgi:hypothetical protein